MIDEDLAAVLARAERIRRQQPQDSNKLYSWHEPEVQCISKGMARQRYEFGVLGQRFLRAHFAPALGFGEATRPSLVGEITPR